jgi:hypothetical protein
LDNPEGGISSDAILILCCSLPLFSCGANVRSP